MDRQRFHLTTPLARSNALRALAAAPDGYTVEIRPRSRSSEQNRLMWPRLEAFASQLDWYGEKLNEYDYKDLLTASLRKSRVVPGIDRGTMVALGLSTSAMTVKEFSALMLLMEAFAAERGVVLPDDGPRPWRREDDAGRAA